MVMYNRGYGQSNLVQDRRHGHGLVLILAVLAVAAVAAVLLASEEAEAWSTTDFDNQYGSNRCGYVRSVADGYETKYQSTSVHVGYKINNFMDRGWMSIPVSFHDDRAFVNSAVVKFPVYGTTNLWVKVRLLTFDPSSAGAGATYYGISEGY